MLSPLLLVLMHVATGSDGGAPCCDDVGSTDDAADDSDRDGDIAVDPAYTSGPMGGGECDSATHGTAAATPPPPPDCDNEDEFLDRVTNEVDVEVDVVGEVEMEWSY